MATKVPTEILIKILNNLQSSSQSTQDLYSSLLVNRIWCKVTIPIIWGLPFGQKCSTKTDTDYKKLKKKALCIRTYISCMDAQLPDAPKVFNKLESFTSELNWLCESLALICDNILNIDLISCLDSQEQLLAKLISTQKRLENLSISSAKPESLFFEAIISQKETLKNLRLKKLNFHCFREKLSLNGQFILLQELYIKNCHGLQESDFLILASSFTQLSSFYYFHPRGYTRYPQEFIIEILKTANTNLRNIFLDVYSLITFDTFSAILNYCTKITELTLHNLSPEQVIAIFNNNFNELKRFSFDCGGKGFDANDLLCQISENVPELLETIEICRMDYNDPWIFSADSLRIFFEGWCRKGRRGNKKFRRLCIRLTRSARYRMMFTALKLETMSREHFDIIKEYGIQLKFDIEN
ncbi:6109_t:CDS:2 [Diversispora eburnea]|uniref:6109_t:CDS:1 n=1 Tax=Diversispora eburnea TaxID=1213867 RepID=A0A9N8VAA7_9GLOM|nr:6109_t:CDS:2 [Diversispora eburnea]